MADEYDSNVESTSEDSDDDGSDTNKAKKRKKKEHKEKKKERREKPSVSFISILYSKPKLYPWCIWYGTMGHKILLLCFK